MSMMTILGISFQQNIEDIDDSAVEKAAYQVLMAEDTDSASLASTAYMMTPYGPGLSVEELTEVVTNYPGIEAGFDTEMDMDVIEDADVIYQQEGFNKLADNIYDQARPKGIIDGITGVFSKVGEAIGGLALDALDVSEQIMFSDFNPGAGFPSLHKEIIKKQQGLTEEEYNKIMKESGNPALRAMYDDDYSIADQYREIYTSQNFGMHSEIHMMDYQQVLKFLLKFQAFGILLQMLLEILQMKYQALLKTLLLNLI